MAIIRDIKRRVILNANIKTIVDLKSKNHNEFEYLAKIIKRSK